MWERMKSAPVSSRSLSLKIFWADLTVSSASPQISPKRQLLNSSLLFSQLKLASPNRTTKIFLEAIPQDWKIFHILVAKSSAGLFPKFWHILRPSFLIVMTVCFWKLWLKDLEGRVFFSTWKGGFWSKWLKVILSEAGLSFSFFISLCKSPVSLFSSSESRVFEVFKISP